MTDCSYYVTNLIKRVIGETAEEQAAAELGAPPEIDADAPLADETVTDKAVTDKAVPPANQELIRMWQQGERMGVAARLMFTEASYVDFVDLVFSLGQQDGRELGRLLDELADTEGIKPPETPPEYDELIQRRAGANEEEGVT